MIPRLVIFDLDGVIVDTAACHTQAWKRLAGEIGLTFPPALADKLRGVGRADAFRVILDANSRVMTAEQIEELSQRKNEYYKELISRLTPAAWLPGVREFIEDIRAQGVKTALGSASKNARAVLKALDAEACFDVIGDGHCAAATKPAPDIFLYVMGKAGIRAPECVVIEDAQAGIDAALNAGMCAIGVMPGLRETHLLLESPTELNYALLSECYTQFRYTQIQGKLL